VDPVGGFAVLGEPQDDQISTSTYRIFAQQIRDVKLYRPLGDVKAIRDLFV
jgi:hypothetical protein